MCAYGSPNYIYHKFSGWSKTGNITINDNTVLTGSWSIVN